MRATRAIIHLNNLRHNLAQVKARLAPGTLLCMAIKADAYGHGALPVAHEAREAGADCFGVATVEEAIELRNGGIEAPVILLGLPFPNEIEALIFHDISTMVASRDLILECDKAARRSGKKLTVHLKIDTGMGRIGCAPDEAPELGLLIARSPNLVHGGTCTHFAGSDLEDTSFAREQLASFTTALSRMRERGVNPGIVHAANSGAIILMPQSFFGMVRPGILLYGYYPSGEQERSLDVRPVMELKTRIAFLKTVAAGTPVSYGMTWRAEHETVIATLPAGYGDGYSNAPCPSG